MNRTRLEGSVWEFTALGTAVRSEDPLLVPFPAQKGQVWSTNLSAEDSASAIFSGFMLHEILLGLSVSTKREDYEVRTQRTSWVNGEVSGLTELIQAARQNPGRGSKSVRHRRRARSSSSPTWSRERSTLRAIRRRTCTPSPS
jgi:hypothetical protein